MNILDTMLANVGMPPAPNGYVLKWVFKNDHEWTKWFATKEEAQVYAFNCGMHTHPDIVSVKFMQDLA
jgi:hypothetical protein